MSTLTFVYADSTAVLGPLAGHAEPHSYDLCEQHAARLTVPRGWEVVRLVTDGAAGPEPETLPPLPVDELTVVAEAVREPSRPRHKATVEPLQVTEVSRRGHLRVLRGDLP